MQFRSEGSHLLKVVSLFTGAGGLDLGFEAAGFQTVACVERDHQARLTLKHNRPTWPQVGCGDTARVQPRDVLNVAGLEASEVDVLLAGPPCQPFSKSAYWSTGETSRLADPRAATLNETLAFTEVLLPRALVIENVRGIAFREKNEAVLLIVQRLKEINRKVGTMYDPVVVSTNAIDYGAPQLRERIFLVAFRDGQRFSRPLPSHGAAPGLLPIATTGQAIGSLANAERDRSELQPTGKWADLLPSIPEGSNYLYHTPRGAGLPLFGWRTRYWSFLLKLDQARPSWTLQADPGPSTGPFHWDSRLLSVLEMKRLQTFPDKYYITGNYRSARRQLGNAVPPVLACAVARRVRAALSQETYPPVGTAASLCTSNNFLPSKRVASNVPQQYLSLLGSHADHPGTGAGPGALSRGITAEHDRKSACQTGS